ncbi:hypothetical protein DPEC_G00327180 [Dallia pectoralis]|uniref:Uncharacterized protein n=1 Tax=Dallia pectoralis TaxID=75939 RepID=A0ACC2F811_DALPE|nr:hypothetical protein DPEC_G00327180 [Dallia pectoralis]
MFHLSAVCRGPSIKRNPIRIQVLNEASLERSKVPEDGERIRWSQVGELSRCYRLVRHNSTTTPGEPCATTERGEALRPSCRESRRRRRPQQAPRPPSDPSPYPYAIKKYTRNAKLGRRECNGGDV